MEIYSIILVFIIQRSSAFRWRINSESKETFQRSLDLSHEHDFNQPGSCYCGVTNNGGSTAAEWGDRIVGGDKTMAGEYPWQGSLLYKGVISNHFCGGTLVSDRHVVTAAHCTQDLDADEIGVAIGYTNLNQSISDRASFIKDVKMIKDHPNYRGEVTHYEFDISVLELAEPIDLTSHPHIKPICLPNVITGRESTTGWYAGDTAVVSGWGLTDFYNGTYPKHLQDVAVKILPKGECGKLTEYIRESQLCAGHNQDGKDACSGDSGGPLMCRDEDNNMAVTLVGVVSAGSTCADADYPGLYADVKLIASKGWLSEALNGGYSCRAPPVDGQTTQTTTTSSVPLTNDKLSQQQVVILMGGDGYAFGRKVELWSPVGGSSCKKALPDLKDYRSFHAAAMSGGYPVICGGQRTLKTCLIMDQDNSWKSYGSTKSYRTGHIMAEIQSSGGAVLLMGGEWSRSNELVVNGKSFPQESSSSDPWIKSSCAVTTDLGTIIVTGGKGGDTNNKQVWEFNGSWNKLVDMPDKGRYDHACTFISKGNTRGIFVTGGSNGLQLQKTSLFYNLNTEKWVPGPALPVQRWGAEIVSMDERIFLLGGGDGRNYLKQVLELDVDNWTWTVLPSELDLLFPRSDFSALVMPTQQFGCEADESFEDLIDPRMT